MKFLFSIFVFISCIFQADAQKPGEVLATANGRNFTVSDLTPEARQLYENQARIVADARTQTLSQMVNEMLLNAESKATNASPAKLVQAEKLKVPDPNDVQIKTLYDANLAAFENKPLQEVRQTIVDYLRRESEEKALKAYIDSLAAKYKVVYAKDVNALDLKQFDSLFTASGRSVSVQEFESVNRIALYDVRANVIDEINNDLESAMLSALVADEAKAQNIDASAFIAREVTDKMREFSDDERADLENAMKRKLFAKYNVKFLLAPPPPIVQNIVADGSPARGKATAPVTVVMFADFQCSACARMHPVLRRVLAEYGDKVRFVVRNFPLENVHENAFRAALAAGAANAQAKFFEYVEVLYQNQDKLDEASLKKYALDLGLNAKQFELDFSSAKTAAVVKKDMDDGNAYGIKGTPTIYVNGVKVRQLSAENFREAIEAALKK